MERIPGSRDFRTNADDREAMDLGPTLSYDEAYDVLCRASVEAEGIQLELLDVDLRTSGSALTTSYTTQLKHKLEVLLAAANVLGEGISDSAHQDLITHNEGDIAP